VESESEKSMESNPKLNDDIESESSESPKLESEKSMESSPESNDSLKSKSSESMELKQKSDK
jgi:hypothetical protein